MNNFEIRCDESHLEGNHTLYGKYTLGPVLPGQGTTLGNALRRTLLADLPGLAITAFEVVGVMQEFSTLTGLRESVLELSLNLKQVVLTGVLPCSTPPIGILKVRGPAIVKAADLLLPTGVYCVSPEQHIATLASNGMLNLRFVVSVGKGHLTQPYSLYRSLSKIKLQPTLSSSLERMGNKGANPLLEGSYESRTGDALHVDAQTKPLAERRWENGSKVSAGPDGNTADIAPFPASNNASQTANRNAPPKPAWLGPNNESLIDSMSVFSGTNSGVSASVKANGSSGYGDVQKHIFQRVNPHQVLPIDAVFAPISKVNFSIQANDSFETTRENLILEIWTNGSIHPKRALEEATLSLVQSFQILLKNIQQASSFYRGLRYWSSLQGSKGSSLDPLESLTPLVGASRQGLGTSHQVGAANSEQAIAKAPTLGDKQGPSDPVGIKVGTSLKAIYNLDIGNLDLSLHTFVKLKTSSIHTLEDLVVAFAKEHNLSNGQSKPIPLLDPKSVTEVKNAVNQLGIRIL